MLIFPTILAKSMSRVLRLFGRRGSALPGLVVERLSPQYLQKMLGQLPKGVVIVSGTNGKTTTTKLMSEILSMQGLRVISNPTGSNFTRGIIAALAEKANLGARLHYDIAVFEQDEAWARQFAKRVHPTGVVVLNVMRDQMDRFGEIDTTADLLAQAAHSATDWVVLNANDRRVAKIAKDARHQKVTWFGHAPELTTQYISDDQHYHKEHVTHFAAAKPWVELKAFGRGHITLHINGVDKTFPSKLDGTHNAINVAAAVAAVIAVLPEADVDAIIAAAASVRPAFGRGERVVLPNGGEIRLQLVKNPAGFTHSLRLLEEETYNAIGLAINDNYADGRDVSWLWDVEYEAIKSQKASVVCGGIRAHDMAVRLRYSDLKASEIIPANQEFLGRMLHYTKENGKTIIFCTYTAMLGLRKLLKKHNTALREEGL
jgi:UDP-N-acetylmuramyl tripeptide synthase